MKKILTLIVVAVVCCVPVQLSAQTYIKLNAPYTLVGILNTQAEFVISKHSSMAFDVTFSPWKSFKGKHLLFGIAQYEYRYYIKQATNGWYISANTGVNIFNMHRPQYFTNGKIFSRQNEYGKGFGVMAGVGVGWEHHLSERWIMDIFISFDRIWSWYNRYKNDGTIEMHPQGHEHYLKPDPFNGSVEDMPVKGGISFGYRIFNPTKNR